MKYKNYIKKHKNLETSNTIRFAVHIMFYCLSLILFALSFTFFVCLKKPSLRMASFLGFLVAGFVACLNSITLWCGNKIKEKERSALVEEGRKLLKEHEINSDRLNKISGEFDSIGSNLKANQNKLMDESNEIINQINKNFEIYNTSENEVEITRADKQIEKLTKEIEYKVRESDQLRSAVVSQTQIIEESINSERFENDLEGEDEKIIVINETSPLESTWGTDNRNALFKSNKQKNYGAIKTMDPTIAPTNQNKGCMLS